MFQVLLSVNPLLVFTLSLRSHAHSSLVVFSKSETWSVYRIYIHTPLWSITLGCRSCRYWLYGLVASDALDCLSAVFEPRCLD